MSRARRSGPVKARDSLEALSVLFSVEEGIPARESRDGVSRRTRGDHSNLSAIRPVQRRCSRLVECCDVEAPDGGDLAGMHGLRSDRRALTEVHPLGPPRTVSGRGEVTGRLAGMLRDGILEMISGQVVARQRRARLEECVVSGDDCGDRRRLR